MAVLKKDRFFKDVAANTSDTQDYTPANGDVLNVHVAYGEAGSSPETIVSVHWDKGGGDEELLFATHANAIDEHVGFSVTGDGTKKLTITLTNNQGTADSLGCGWRD